MKPLKPFLVVLLLFALLLSAKADKLKTGFARLRIHDYFLAKQLFEESLKKKTPGAAYGLSIIYSLNNNPFYNLDSARRYVLLADSTLNNLNNKKKEYYLLLGVSSLAIQAQKDSICIKAMRRAVETSTVDYYDRFLLDFNFCRLNDEVILKRNALAFEAAKSINTAQAYYSFLKTYPESKEFSEAKTKFDERTYVEATTGGQIESYIKFLNDYPQSPYRIEAEKQIYLLTAPDKSVEQLHRFIIKFPGNHFVEDAWRELYARFMKDYNEQVYEKFKEQFPDYPFKDELLADYKLHKAFFIPVSLNGKFGFIDDAGQLRIKPVYDYADFFSEGLTVVEKEGKFGYIDKTGTQVIGFNFDDAEKFVANTAVVRQGDYSGLINRKGEFIIKPVFDELSEPVEGICLGMLNGKLGYVTKTGATLTECIYDEAGMFRNGLAIVGINDRYGVLNATGARVLELKYDELFFLTDSLIVAVLNGRYGVLNIRGHEVQNFIFDFIGVLIHKRALVVSDNKCGFLNQNGQIEIPISYSFSESMINTTQYAPDFILIKQKNKKILINSLNLVVNLSAFEDFLLPQLHWIAVKKKRLWGFADYNGKLKYPCIYQQLRDYDSQLAIVKKHDGLFGVIDINNQLVVPFKYDNIQFADNYLLVTQAGLNGLANRLGEEVIGANYDKIYFISSNLVELIQNGKKMYYNLALKKVIFGKE